MFMKISELQVEEQEKKTILLKSQFYENLKKTVFLSQKCKLM